MSTAEIPRLVRFFISVAFSIRWGHLFRCAVLALPVPLWFCQPQLHTPYELILMLVGRGQGVPVCLRSICVWGAEGGRTVTASVGSD
jgi:hypothetical protein